MKLYKTLLFCFTSIIAFSVVIISCQKLDKPALGDYPPEINPPGGLLQFYVAFDGTTTDTLRNGVDSIKNNFPLSHPLAYIPGISGMGVQGPVAKDKAIKYTNANDFAKSTSITIAFWMKSSPPADGDPEYLFSLPSNSFAGHNSALFLSVEKGDPVDPNFSTPALMACKLVILNKSVDFIGVNRLPNVLNGSWHHIVFTYDQTSSKVTAYVDGAAFNFTGTGNILMNGAIPMGPLSFLNAAQNNLNSFIIGGWNKHVPGLPTAFRGLTGASIHSYSGQMDQFRLYSKALSAAEILALYNSKL